MNEFNPNREDPPRKKLDSPFLRICPACGYSFRVLDPKTMRKTKICPACGHKFIEPSIHPQKPDEFGKRFI